MPKGGASSLTPVYAGLREDLDDFLKSFLLLNSVRFSDYKTLFQHRGMVQLLSGRSNSAEIIEFNECLLVHCLPYMDETVCPGVPRSLHERIFGLYSLYTFFYIQHSDHVVKVRMDPDASRNFRKLTEILLQEKIYDAYMSCLKLLEDKAIKHVAFINIHDPSNFKRFYTDDKVSRTILRTNLNDPLSSVKALIESEVFRKLGIIRREYMKAKKKAGFEGVYLEDVQGQMKQIVEQYSRSIEGCYGVDKIINTDHSSEHLTSRGMLRSTIKEQAHASNLKLARYRRHRSATPLDIPTDTFNYVQDLVSEDNKPVKSELGSPDSTLESPLKQKTRQRNRNKSIKRGSEDVKVFSDESPSRKIIKVQREIEEVTSASHNSDTLFQSDIKSPNVSISDQFFHVEDDIDASNKDTIVKESAVGKRKLKRVLSIDNDNKMKPEIEEIVKMEVEPVVEQPEIIEENIDEKIAIKCNEHQNTTEVSNEDLHIDDIGPPSLASSEPSTPIASPKSILKKEKKTKAKHVCFSEEQDGKLDITIHEFSSPCSDDYYGINEKSVPSQIKEEPEDYIIDDDDMFAPFDGDTIGPGWTENDTDDSEEDFYIDED